LNEILNLKSESSEIKLIFPIQGHGPL